MKRRDFLTGLLLAVTTGTSTQAQQKAKVYRLAIMDPASPITDVTAIYRGFFERLQQLGFAEGRNLEIKGYFGERPSERFGDMILEAISLKPDVIFVTSTRLLLKFKVATTTIPLVGLMGDPV